jgi:hypothetical protein
MRDNEKHSRLMRVQGAPAALPHVGRPGEPERRRRNREDEWQRHIDRDQVVPGADLDAGCIAADHPRAARPAGDIVHMLPLAAEQTAEHIRRADEIAIELVERDARGKAEHDRHQQQAGGKDAPAFAGDGALRIARALRRGEA